MIFKVPQAKIIYSEEPQNRLEYTTKLDAEYTLIARLYDLAVKHLPVWKKWISAVLPHIKGPRVLEASFGTGYLLMQYARRFETHGIDFNASMVDTARRNLRCYGLKAELRQANVESLPFADNRFDTVINTMAFSGYPSGSRALAEFHRILKPGGRLLLVDYDYPDNRNRLGYGLTKMMELAGDTIRNIGDELDRFPFQYTQREIGRFGSVHFYQAARL